MLNMDRGRSYSTDEPDHEVTRPSKLAGRYHPVAVLPHQFADYGHLPC